MTDSDEWYNELQQYIKFAMNQSSNRLKTEGAVLDRANQMNLEKYGQQLKSELEEISKLLSKKKNPSTKEDSSFSFRKGTKESGDSKPTKTIASGLDESIYSKNKDKERENRRNLIYEAESCREVEEEIAKKEKEESEMVKLERVKSYTETMSTASSHTKTKPNSKQDQGMKVSDFILGKKLGQGKFGEVFIAQHRTSGFICALKRIFRSNLDEKMMLQLARQIKIQHFLNHPNIVRLYTFFSDEKAIYLVQELCCSGQIFGLLKKKRKIAQDLVRLIVQQICRALDYMHECEIIHRDLKPQNIIYQYGLVKICDFGWSISSKTMRETFCGTPLYISPELLKRKSYNNKIDVWSIGILTYQLLFGRVPFEIVTQRDFIKIIQDEIRFAKTMNISEEAKDFIRICLNKDPRDRYTIPELLEHPFIVNIDNPILAELY